MPEAERLYRLGHRSSRPQPHLESNVKPKIDAAADSRAKAVQAVERGVLVTLRERRIVENGIDEIVNFAAERKDCLPDMHQFNGALANNVNAEQLTAIAMEQQLHETDTVAEDLAARQFTIRRLAGLIRNALFGQFFFVFSDKRDLRNR